VGGGGKSERARERESEKARERESERSREREREITTIFVLSSCIIIKI
jgi:hypothetical protein